MGSIEKLEVLAFSPKIDRQRGTNVHMITDTFAQ